MSYSTVDLHLI